MLVAVTKAFTQTRLVFYYCHELLCMFFHDMKCKSFTWLRCHYFALLMFKYIAKNSFFSPYCGEKKLHGKLVANISLNKHWRSVDISNVTKSAITYKT